MSSQTGFRFLTRLTDIQGDTSLDEEDRSGLYDQHDREIEDYVSRIHLYTTKMTRRAVVGGDSTTSTSYVNPTTNSCRVAFFKKYPETVIVARTYVTCYNSVAGTQVVSWGVNDGTTTTDIMTFFFNNANTHHSMAGEAHLSGVTVGNHTFSLVWKTGAGDTMNMDANDTLELSITEMLGNS